MSRHLWFGPSIVQEDACDHTGGLRGARPVCPKCGAPLNVSSAYEEEPENEREVSEDGRHCTVSFRFCVSEMAPFRVWCEGCGLNLRDYSHRAAGWEDVPCAT